MAIKHFFITALIYFVLLIPFKTLFSLVPGYEMKIITFLPAVLGIFWGPSAALGVAVGNFAGDMVVRDTLYIAITSSIAIFFQAYLPYKLWYTFKMRREEEYIFIYDIKSVMKFTYILFLTSATVSALFGMIVGSSGMRFSQETFSVFFFNNFDFALILGLPILVLLGNSNFQRYVPVKDKINVREKGWYDSILYLVSAIGMGYVFWFQHMQTIDALPAFFIWMGMFVVLVFYCQKPIIYEHEFKKSTDNLHTFLYKNVMKGFFCGVLIFIGFIFSFAYFSFVAELFVDKGRVWNYLYMNMILAIHLMFAIALLFLYFGEKKIAGFTQLPKEKAGNANKNAK